MQIDKRDTETYVITDLDGLDPITVYVTNYEPGKGKIVIQCYCDSWVNYWGGMGGMNLQQFFCSCDNGYILRKLLKKTHETDFDKVTEAAGRRGYDISVTNDVELAMQCDEMVKCYGPDWYMDLPQRKTNEYHHLERIVNVIKSVFAESAEQ